MLTNHSEMHGEKKLLTIIGFTKHKEISQDISADCSDEMYMEYAVGMGNQSEPYCLKRHLTLQLHAFAQHH